jgi:hypothetical protein
MQYLFHNTVVSMARDKVDKNGLQAAKRLNARHENTRLFGIRIGYNVAASFGGVMERVSR